LNSARLNISASVSVANWFTCSFPICQHLLHDISARMPSIPRVHIAKNDPALTIL
jgi:hypothetical protein